MLWNLVSGATKGRLLHRSLDGSRTGVSVDQLVFLSFDAMPTSLLEDEQGTHKQDHNRFNAMKKKAEAVDIGSEMKKPEGLIVPTRRQNFSTAASAPRRSLDGARRRGAGGIV